jgi:hypothetical protein
MAGLVLFAALGICMLSPGTAFAAASGGTIRGNNFNCTDGICTCDGSYADCKGMEINCIDGKVKCRDDAPNICQCIQVRRVKPGVLDKSIAPVVPKLQQ